MAIVWPCLLAVDAYVAAGRDVGFPRPSCPSCAGPPVFWPGYRRNVREAGRCRKIFVPRLRCAPCGASHALLPAFTLAWRLDTAKTVGVVVTQVAGGAKRLDRLATRTEEAWREAAELIETKKPREYDGAVSLLRDLQALAEREGGSAEFRQRFGELRARHDRKPSLQERFDKAGLPS